MALYAIGDIHGCYAELRQLLHEIGWRRGEDRLWFVGDLINRGPRSLDVIRFVQDLGERAVVIQGNHELRAVQGMFGSPGKVFQEHMGYLLEASDADLLRDWLRRLPFLVRDEGLRVTMVHAGLHPGWGLAEAVARADELAAALRDDARLPGLLELLGKALPEREPEGDEPLERMRFAAAVFTRIRLCTAGGELLWPKAARESGVNPFLPPPSDSPVRSWHDLPRGDGEELVIYGHWAAAGITVRSRTIGLDGGCVYGGRLAAMRLDHAERPIQSIPTPQYVAPDGE